MKESNTKKFSLREFLLRTLTDPVMWYTALMMTALMYHYRDREKSDEQGYPFAFGWGIAAIAGCWLMFRVFDYIQKHHLIGSVAYILLVSVFGVGVRISLNIGAESYDISWLLWFLTPQDSLNYNYWYTLGFFLLFLLFMGSVIYYFTRVRYRIFMNFLIFIIPFAIYGKEYEKMPTGFIILLAVGYVLLMVYYRQLVDDEKSVFVGRKQSWKAIAVYAVVFSSFAAIVPKPKVEADRSYLESLINAEALTDRLVDMLNVFRDTTSGQQFRSRSKNWLVYEAKAVEPLRIKTETFSKYNFSDDSWGVVKDVDSIFGDQVDSAPMNIGSRMGVADAFLKAAELDSDYAEKYGLTEYVKEGLDEPDVRQVKFYTMSGIVGVSEGTHMAPVPQGAIALTDCTRKGKMTRLRGGVVYSVNSPFSTIEKYTFDYSADTFFLSRKNNEFIDNLAKYDYEELLSDTDDVLYWTSYLDSSDEEDVRIYDYFLVDLENYQSYLKYYLGYGNNTRIKELADEITKDCKTEYEKATAIESYFYNNDFIYDLSYKKKKGENAEDFLFETHRGVCYEYATAMVLLARAAGIPARYCEGYNMTKHESSNFSNEGSNYIVNTEDAHGFPELYIRGYGWLSFEPTIADVVVEEERSSATDMLTKAGLGILSVAVLILLISFTYPFLSHKFFIMRNKRRSPNETVKAIMHRICRIYEIESANTSREVAALVYEISRADITAIAEMFDKAAYGEQQLSEQEKESAMSEYIIAYEALRESKKRKHATN